MKKLFKITSVILIQAFMVTNLAWAAGGEFFIQSAVINADTLAPELGLSKDDIKTIFQEVIEKKQGTGISKSTLFSRARHFVAQKLSGRPEVFRAWIDEILTDQKEIFDDEQLLELAKQLGIGAADSRLKEAVERAQASIHFTEQLPKDEKLNVYIFRDAAGIYSTHKIIRNDRNSAAIYLSKSFFGAITKPGRDYYQKVLLEIMRNAAKGKNLEQEYEKFREDFMKLFREEVEKDKNLKQAIISTLNYLKEEGILEDVEKGLRFIDTTRAGTFPLFLEGIFSLPLKDMGLWGKDLNNSTETLMYYSRLSSVIRVTDSENTARASESKFQPVDFMRIDEESIPIFKEVSSSDKNIFYFQTLVLRNEALKRAESSSNAIVYESMEQMVDVLPNEIEKKLKELDLEDAEVKSARDLMRLMQEMYDAMGFIGQFYHNHEHNLGSTYGMLLMTETLTIANQPRDKKVAFLGALLHDFHIRILRNKEGNGTPAFVEETLAQLEDLLGIKKYEDSQTNGAREYSDYKNGKYSSYKDKMSELIRNFIGSDSVNNIYNEVAVLIRRTDFAQKAAMPVEYQEMMKAIRQDMDRELQEKRFRMLTTTKMMVGSRFEEINQLIENDIKLNEEQKIAAKEVLKLQRNIEISYLDSLQNVIFGRREVIHQLAQILETADKTAFSILCKPKMNEKHVTPGLKGEIPIVNVAENYPFFFVPELLSSEVLAILKNLPDVYKKNFIDVVTHYANLTTDVFNDWDKRFDEVAIRLGMVELSSVFEEEGGFFADVGESHGDDAHINYYLAKDFLGKKINKGEYLNEQDILVVHELLGNSQEPVQGDIFNPGYIAGERLNVPGQYRGSPFEGIGGVWSPTPQRISGLVNEFLDWLAEELGRIENSNKTHQDKKNDVLELAAKSHYIMTLIHPFSDGNGRIARLITNYILEKNEFWLSKEDRDEYDKSIEHDHFYNFGYTVLEDGTRRKNSVDLQLAEFEVFLEKDPKNFKEFLSKYIVENSLEEYKSLESKMQIKFVNGDLDSVIFIDVDWMRLLNRMIGKDNVNVLLELVFNTLKEALQELGEDKAIIDRRGGDEILFILNANADPKRVRRIAEKIKSKVENSYFAVGCLEGEGKIDARVLSIIKEFGGTVSLIGGKRRVLIVPVANADSGSQRLNDFINQVNSEINGQNELDPFGRQVSAINRQASKLDNPGIDNAVNFTLSMGFSTGHVDYTQAENPAAEGKDKSKQDFKKYGRSEPEYVEKVTGESDVQQGQSVVDDKDQYLVVGFEDLQEEAVGDEKKARKSKTVAQGVRSDLAKNVLYFDSQEAARKYIAVLQEKMPERFNGAFVAMMQYLDYHDKAGKIAAFRKKYNSDPTNAEDKRVENGDLKMPNEVYGYLAGDEMIALGRIIPMQETQEWSEDYDIIFIRGGPGTPIMIAIPKQGGQTMPDNTDFQEFTIRVQERTKEASDINVGHVGFIYSQFNMGDEKPEPIGTVLERIDKTRTVQEEGFSIIGENEAVIVAKEDIDAEWAEFAVLDMDNAAEDLIRLKQQQAQNREDLALELLLEDISSNMQVHENVLETSDLVESAI